MLKKTILFLFYLIPIFGSEPVDLGQYEKSLYSEYGEDGILAKLFQLYVPTSKYLVHLGAADGISSNSSSYLLRLQEWKGLLIDRQYENPAINLQKEFITAENINTLFLQYNVPTDLDLLLIDLHYNDFHIWKALDPIYRPALVVIEYNGMFSPTDDKVITYRSFYAGDKTDYFGASILALYHLGRSKGYNLIYAEKGGAYLFFLREDLLNEIQFINMNDPEKLYYPPLKTYLEDSRHRKYTSASNLIGAP